MLPQSGVTQADVSQAGSCLPTPTELVTEGNGAVQYHKVQCI